MNTTTHVTAARGALAALAVALVSLSAPTAAHAAEGHVKTDDLKYHSVSWTAAHGTKLDAVAPTTWKLTVTRTGEGRFNDPSHQAVLAVAWSSESPKQRVHDEVAALQGTDGLKIVKHSAGGGYGELSYSYTRPDGERRWVHYVYDMGQSISIAGPLADRAGLEQVQENDLMTCGGG